jgi:hypothetical protein
MRSVGLHATRLFARHGLENREPMHSAVASVDALQTVIHGATGIHAIVIYLLSFLYRLSQYTSAQRGTLDAP